MCGVCGVLVGASVVWCLVLGAQILVDSDSRFAPNIFPQSTFFVYLRISLCFSECLRKDYESGNDIF